MTSPHLEEAKKHLKAFLQALGEEDGDAAMLGSVVEFVDKAEESQLYGAATYASLILKADPTQQYLLYAFARKMHEAKP